MLDWGWGGSSTVFLWHFFFYTKFVIQMIRVVFLFCDFAPCDDLLHIRTAVQTKVIQSITTYVPRVRAPDLNH